MEGRVPVLAHEVRVRPFLEQELAHLEVLVQRRVVERRVPFGVGLAQVGFQHDEVERPDGDPLVLSGQSDDLQTPLLELLLAPEKVELGLRVVLFCGALFLLLLLLEHGRARKLALLAAEALPGARGWGRP